MARKKESLFWDRVRPLLGGWDPVRVENGEVGAGTPDVNCLWGWIELKQVPKSKIPKRTTTVLRIDHFTPQQRAWLARRWDSGGACGLLLLLGDEWLLFDGMTAALTVGKVNTQDTRVAAYRLWPKTPERSAFRGALISMRTTQLP